MSIADSPTCTNLREQAESFVLTQIDTGPTGNRDHLVSQTTEHLLSKMAISRQRAGLEAAAAVATIESNQCKGFIDISRSTSSCVFLMVDGVRRAVSLLDLMRLLEQEPA